MSCSIGIDIGSSTTKGILLKSGKVVADYLVSSGGNYCAAAQSVRAELIDKAGLKDGDVSATVVTGHNVSELPFRHRRLADIRCCARGIRHLLPKARTIIDIQSLGSRAIRLSAEGTVTDFTASEKCAAGSGRLLELMVNILRIDFEEIGLLSLKSEAPVSFTTSCAVFEESEVISRIAEGVAVSDILAGIHESLAEKLAALLQKIGLEEEVALSGGGALDEGLIKSLEKKLDIKLLVPPQPRLVTALGAAIMAD
jgi:predicted CoA-substrate-specific enzyme activase